MKATEERNARDSAGEISGGGTVVVGVRLDEHSRELLTWALVKVAESGDRVIALHVLKPCDAAAGKSTLLSLVKSFDSVLAAYEGFCNLKQVDLKLKVCRGSSVREVLVREAKSYTSAKIIVGISRTQHTIRSTLSVAKYCARKLPKDFWVFGVDNGKVLYQRRARTSITSPKDYAKRKNFVRSIPETWSKKSKSPRDAVGVAGADHNCEVQFSSPSGRNSQARSGSPVRALLDSSFSKSRKVASGDDDVDNSLALVPIRSCESTPSSNSLVASDHCELKRVRSFIRRIFLPHRQSLEKFSAKKFSVADWVLKSPNRHCSAAVYPDQKQIIAKQDELHSPGPGQENGVMVPYGSPDTIPLPCCTLHPRTFSEELEGLHEKYSSTCRLFSYKELLSLTSNFLPEKMIGKGGNSQVYKGCLPDGREVAVKSLKPSENVLKEFVSEIEIITTLHHKNIISLFGFCFEGKNLLLVYDFLPRGSLEENLHGSKKDGVSLGWGERYKVALGVAEALDYLHCGSVKPVIHRDVKSSNILLLDDFEPQLSDFGLATLASTSLSHITCTDVAGTFGYLAPEYFMYGKVDEKIDVYAYGVVLLELLSGRKPIYGKESIVTWAMPILKGGNFSQLLDPSLGVDYDQDQIERMKLAAVLCIRRTPCLRPQIGQVLKLLQGDIDVISWAREEANALGELDAVDGEVFPIDMQSHLNTALQGLEDDSLSSCSTETSISVEDYLRGRWSRSTSFD